MDADYYLETIATVFQDFKLVNGTWDVKGVDGKVERVRPQDIQGTALMTVEGELDDISGSGQTRAAQDLCSGVPASERQHLEVPGAGHYGIFSGRRWRDIVYPELVKFIVNHAPKTAEAAKPQATETPKAVVQASAPSAPAKASTSQAAPVSAVKPPAQEVVKPAAKTASVATAKPVVAKPVTPAASKPAVKASTKSTVKVATKTAAKPATAPLSKASGKGTASGSVKTTWVDPSTKA
jgi:poly(3-hydroxybutyrate) depolymerase